jgi:hypothetical protein
MSEKKQLSSILDLWYKVKKIKQIKKKATSKTLSTYDKYLTAGAILVWQHFLIIEFKLIDADSIVSSHKSNSSDKLPEEEGEECFIPTCNWFIACSINEMLLFFEDRVTIFIFQWFFSCISVLNNGNNKWNWFFILLLSEVGDTAQFNTSKHSMHSLTVNITSWHSNSSSSNNSSSRQ